MEKSGTNWQAISDLLKGMSQPVVVIDPQGVIQLFNQAAGQLFGHDPADMPGKPVTMLMDEPHATSHQGYLDAYAETGIRKIIGIGRELPARHKSGKVLPIELAVNELKLDDGRHVFVGMVSDLSGRKAAESIAAEEHERFARLVETSPDGVIAIDLTGRMRVYNAACEQMFGYQRADVIGRNIKMLMPQGYAERHDDYLSTYRKTGEKHIIGIGREVQGQRNDGSIFPLDLSVGEVTLATGETQYIGILRDLTNKRETELRIQSLQGDLSHLGRIAAMNEMGTALAHELNQPLTAMMLYLTAAARQMQLAGINPPELFDKAINEGERAGEIIRRMRRFVEKGDMRREYIDLHSIIHEAAELVNTGQRKGLPAIALNLPEDQDLMAEVDNVQMTQVLVNLMRNAQQACADRDGACVLLEARQDDGHIQICIHDNGPGVPDNLLKSVFRPFISTKNDGLGLGLSISKSILTAHSASLEVSNNGKLGGASFCIRFVAGRRDKDEQQ